MASDAQTKHQGTWFTHSSVAIRFLFIATSLLTAYHYYSPSSSSPFIPSLFALHVGGMSLGVLLFLPEAIMQAMTMRRGLVGEKREAAALMHVIFTASALVLILGGFISIYSNKNEMKKNHFTSLHSKFGLAFMLMSIAAASGGLLSWRPLAVVSSAILPSFVRGKIKMVHRWAGLITWLLGMATVMIILLKPSMYQAGISQLLQAGVGATAIVICILSAYAANVEGPARVTV